MPTFRFIVEVSVNDKVGDTNSVGMVTADAVKYLVYADQTDLFGYHGKVKDVSCNKRHRNAYGSVTIEFVAPVTSEREIVKWRSEMKQLSRVKRTKVCQQSNE